MRSKKSLPLAALLLFFIGSQANAETLRFTISESPANAFLLWGGLSGHEISASIAGTFSITKLPNMPAELSDFDLRLSNVTENFALAHFDIQTYENKPLRDLLPIDIQSLTGQPSVMPNTYFVFARPSIFNPEVVSLDVPPTAAMTVVVLGNSATVVLSARLRSPRVLDGPSLRFQPLTASVVPEPATIALAGVYSLALAALRRRK